MDQIENITTGGNTADDEISLIDLFAVLLKRKWMIIITTVIAMFGAVVFCIISLKLPPEKSPLPNIYKPEAHMLINDSNSSGGGLSSLINSSGLGGLASLAGISTGGGSSYSALAVYFAESNTFLDSVVDTFDLINKWEIEKFPRASSREALKKVLRADFDEKSGVFKISFEDIDPAFAQKVVNFSVDKMEQMFLDMGLDKNKLEKRNLEENIENAYKEILRLQKEIQGIESRVSNVYNSYSAPSIVLDASMLKIELTAQESVYEQLKVQYELLKIKMASETPVFQVLEKAEIPDRKSGPSRGKLCIIITFAAGFMSVFAAFLLNAIDNIKQDPVVMEKLKATK